VFADLDGTIDPLTLADYREARAGAELNGLAFVEVEGNGMG
jgi:hypothetical protein